MAPAPAKQEVEQTVASSPTKGDTSPTKAGTSPTSVDLSALADAVAQHETGYCTSPGSPTANARNNCWGIMTYYYDAAGVKHRTLRTFKSIDEGKQAFMELWQRGYGGRMPTMADAKLYSGNDMATTWHANVHKFYAAKVAK